MTPEPGDLGPGGTTSDPAQGPPAYLALVRYGQMLARAEFLAQAPGYAKGDRCVVRSERGLEVGTVIAEPRPIPPGLVLPEEGRREILRRISEQDVKKLRVLDREERTREFAFCASRIAKRGLAMKLVKVEHLFGGDVIVFYYTAEVRVDLRGLTRDLATELKSKIQLRLVGARDEARLLGDFNGCGQQLCCQTFIGEFAPVTMKMAKNQMTTLDPAKITGRCGRLMCCLRYEDDHYAELKRVLPRKAQRVRTRDGAGTVVAINVLAGQVTVELEGRRRRQYDAFEVQPIAREAEAEAGPTIEHVYVTAPPLRPDRLPDATALHSVIAADVVARYQRLRGATVYFPLSVARYSAALQAAAVPLGTPVEHQARLAEVLGRLGVTAAPVVDTDNRHHVRTVADFCRRLAQVGDLYPADFDGTQCADCHASRPLDPASPPSADERCRECGGALERVVGRCYLFRLSRFQRKLLAAIQTRADSIRPHIRKLALEDRIKRGLADPVVARSTYARGLPIAQDPAFRLAGWFEGLLAYVSCLVEDESLYATYWPARYQIAPRGSLWLHGVIWPAMLLAGEVELPQHLVVHGDRDVPGVASDAAVDELARAHGGDAVRYALLRDQPLGIDGRFDAVRAAELWQTEIQGELGGLVGFVVSLAGDVGSGAFPRPADAVLPERQVGELVQELYAEATLALDRLHFAPALERLRHAWTRLSALARDPRPPAVAPEDSSPRAVAARRRVLELGEALRILSLLLWPLLPRTAERIQLALGLAPRFEGLASGVEFSWAVAGCRVDPTVTL